MASRPAAGKSSPPPRPHARQALPLSLSPMLKLKVRDENAPPSQAEQPKKQPSASERVASVLKSTSAPAAPPPRAPLRTLSASNVSLLSGDLIREPTVAAPVPMMASGGLMPIGKVHAVYGKVRDPSKPRPPLVLLLTDFSSATTASPAPRRALAAAPARVGAGRNRAASAVVQRPRARSISRSPMRSRHQSSHRRSRSRELQGSGNLDEFEFSDDDESRAPDRERASRGLRRGGRAVNYRDLSSGSLSGEEERD